MTVHQLAQTNSFTITFDDAFPTAQRRAQAVAATCEHDLDILLGWFGVEGAFGPSDRITVAVGALSNPHALGDNWGYQHDASLIELGAFAWAFDESVLDGFAQAVFVAELAEVLMGARNNQLGHNTWNAGDSAGEALSTICEELLHRIPCYQVNQGFPRGQDWLATSNWPDWISSTDGTDQHFVSFGCGILFISFLMGQLGLEIGQIIQAEGQTLEEKFHALTGRSGGYSEMTGVLSDFFAHGSRELVSDFPFPLLPAADRTLSLGTIRRVTATTPAGSGQTEITLPFPCRGSLQAQYSLTHASYEVSLTAIPRGFGHPSFAWSLPASSGPPLVIPEDGIDTTVELPVTLVDPVNPTTPPTTSTASIHVIAQAPSTVTFGESPPPFPVAQLDLHIDGGAAGVSGTAFLTLECTASDAVSAGTSSGGALIALPMLGISYDAPTREEMEGCRAKATDLVNRFKPNLLARILPDPPPDLDQAVALLRELATEVSTARAAGDKQMADGLLQVAVDHLGIPEYMLNADPAQTAAPSAQLSSRLSSAGHQP
jgi:hypothetical protein